MRSVSLQIFDDVINGTTTSWYSGAQLNPILGAIDTYALQVCTTFVGTPAPTLTVTSQHSADNQNWFNLGDDIAGTVIANDQSYWKWRDGVITTTGIMANLRFRITLSGTSGARARVRLYFTGRVRSGSAQPANGSALQGFTGR